MRSLFASRKWSTLPITSKSCLDRLSQDQIALQNRFRADVGDDACAVAGLHLAGGSRVRRRRAAGPAASTATSRPVAAGPGSRTRRDRRLRRRPGNHRLVEVPGTPAPPAASERSRTAARPILATHKTRPAHVTRKTPIKSLLATNSFPARDCPMQTVVDSWPATSHG